MRDGFSIQTLPFFTGALAFLPGCGATTSVDDTSTGETTATVTVTMTAADSSSSTDDPSTTLTTSPTTTDTETTSPETTDPTTETGDPGCSGGTCGTPADEGWFGPAIYARVAVDGELPSCTPEYPEPGPTLLEGFTDPGPAICDCTCEIMAAPNCNGGLRLATDNACNSWNYNLQVSAACQNIVQPNINSMRFYSYGYGVGTCDKEEIEEIAPIPWDATIRTCRLPDNALECGEGGVCLPAQPEGFESNWCMYKQGDAECPAGPYSNKMTFFSGAEDTRECTNCTCGTAGTNCAENAVDVFASPDCEGLPVATIAANACGAGGLSVAGTVGAEMACPVMTPPEATGTVLPMGDFTFCCTE